MVWWLHKEELFFYVILIFCVHVYITGPESKRFVPKIMEAGTPGTFVVEYTPTVIGQ